MKKVAFFGSGYITRFEEYCMPKGMKVPSDVKFFGKEDMTAKEAIHTKELGELFEYCPDVVFVVIGENDITDSCTLADVFQSILDLVGALKDAGIERVFVTEILHRGEFPNSPEMTERRFKSIRSSINKKIYKTFGEYRVRAKDIKFPKHYEEDMVCLNETGLRAFYFLFTKIICSLKFL